MVKREKIIIRGSHNIVISEVRDQFEMRTIYTLGSYATTDIEVLAVENIKGIKTPDVKMNGLLWEIKNPKGSGKYVISRNIYNASKQAPNIILDLRRMMGSYRHYMPEIEREFKANPRAKKLLVVTKAQTIIELTK